MFLNDKLLIGKNENSEAYLLLNKANRHGLITGASGSGKTITLKVLSESFADANVPVFLVDIKGDLAATALQGVDNENVRTRIDNLKLENFNFKNYSTIFWDIYGKNGHPIRTTVSKVGAKLLSRLLNLTDAQEGILTIIFKIAEDENKELIDLKDLRAMITYVGDNKKEYTIKYGNINTQSLGSIQRSLLTLEEDDGEYFFGKPDFDITDFIKFNANTGKANINILHGVELFHKPTFYATFILWLLTTLYNTMPEVGDLEKPKLVFFIDEAHLLFNEIPDHLLKQIIQIVKLIRSKAIGLYFISQCPSDIPDDILSQLGNRIQHVLRSYTPKDDRAIKAAADSYRANPNFDTEEAIKTLATGEALISFQNEKGEPSIVDKFTILPPQSMMGPITDAMRQQFITTSPFYLKYENKIEEISAYEKINEEKKQEIEEYEREQAEKEKLKEEKKKEKEKGKKSGLEKMGGRLANKTIDTIGRKIGNAIFKKIFK
ncbi:MAG: DUF853 family protein [Firmicutes bacterium]|nr:DUF853 family protein [Bacillota bacterium]